MRLDATPAGRPVYLQLGFSDDRPLQRWRREGTGDPASLPAAAPRDVLDSSHWELDRRRFGADRRRWLQLLAADSAFGEPVQGARIPATITNSRPDLVTRSILRRGIELMLDSCAERGIPAWQQLSERFGVDATSPKTDRLDEYLALVYSESEPW